MMTMRLWMILLTAGLCLACGDSTNGDEATSGTRGVGAGVGSPVGSGTGGAGPAGAGGHSQGGSGGEIGYGGGGDVYSLTFGPVDVEPGVERTQCVVKRLDNPEAIRVGRIRNNLGGFSHHMILYTTSDGEERPDPFNCNPFTDSLDPSNGAPLMVSQKLEDTLQLPDGVGFVLEERQMLRIELHFINTSATTQSMTASTELALMPDALFEHEAGFVFIGTPDITIPAMSQHTVGPVHIKMPADYAPAQFFAVTGHTHQWGTNVIVDTADAAGTSVDGVYSPAVFAWEEPETTFHDPAFSLPSGGGFNFSCSWDNLSTAQVGFGESAQQEMCFFWAYYYPNVGSRVCVHSEQLPGGIDMCCPGSPLCGQLF